MKKTCVSLDVDMLGEREMGFQSMAGPVIAVTELHMPTGLFTQCSGQGRKIQAW
jgi:hypothetical protein